VPGSRLSAHRYAAEAKPSVSPTGLYGNDADDKPYGRYVHCSSVLFAVLWWCVLLHAQLCIRAFLPPRQYRSRIVSLLNGVVTEAHGSNLTDLLVFCSSQRTYHWRFRVPCHRRRCEGCRPRLRSPGQGGAERGGVAAGGVGERTQPEPGASMHDMRQYVCHWADVLCLTWVARGVCKPSAMGPSHTLVTLLVNGSTCKLSFISLVHAIEMSVMTVHVNCSIGNGHVHGRVVLEPLQAVAEGAGIETRAAGRQTGTFAVL
jgi:hypothetical protein